MEQWKNGDTATYWSQIYYYYYLLTGLQYKTFDVH